MEAQIKGNVAKVKSSQSQQIKGSSSSKEKRVVPLTNTSKTKIIKSSSNISKSVATEKTASTSSKTTTKTVTVKGKTEKKAYTLPGQKHDPPEEREPLRIFYESLFKQIPTSEMAEFWMMEHGLLSPERAKKAYERKQKKQHQLRTGTPTKSPQKDRSESLLRKQPSKNGDLKTKKRMNYSDDEDEFIVKPKKRERPS